MEWYPHSEPHRFKNGTIGIGFSFRPYPQLRKESTEILEKALCANSVILCRNIGVPESDILKCSSPINKMSITEYNLGVAGEELKKYHVD